MLHAETCDLENAVVYLFQESIRSRLLTDEDVSVCRHGLPHTNFSSILHALITAFNEYEPGHESGPQATSDVPDHSHRLLLHALHLRYISGRDYARLQEFVHGCPSHSILKIFATAIRQAVGC